MIEINNNRGIAANEITGFTFESSSNPREMNSLRTDKEELNYQDNYFTVGEWRILSFGINDNLPDVIKKAVQDNSTAPGMIEKKVMMTLGNGPFLYTEDIEEGLVVRTTVQDQEIQDWLDTWRYEDYLHKCAVDYHHMKGHTSKVYKNKAGRVGSEQRIAKLEHILAQEARLACHINSTDLIPTHIVVTDYRFGNLNSFLNIKVYPIFDIQNPFLYPTTATYTNEYTFGDKHYSTPPLFGSLEWLRRSTATPLIFKALSDKSISVKYHVESPQDFWDSEEERLKENAEKAGREYDNQEIIDYRLNFIRDLLKVMTGLENTGKVWHTRKKLDIQGTNIIAHGWTITPITENIIETVNAHIKISERADRALSANLGMGSGLSNTSESGKANGGSEQIYAYQNFMNSSVDVPERIITQPLNDCIKINFPNKKCKIGFQRNHAQTLSNINPSNRPIKTEPKK